MANLNYGANYQSPMPPPTNAAFQKSLTANNAAAGNAGPNFAAQQNGATDLLNWLQGQNTTQQFYNNLNAAVQNTGLQQQIGALGANEGLQSGYLNQQYQNQLAQMGLTGQQYGLQLGSIGQQQTEAQQRYNLQNQMLNQQWAQAQQGAVENYGDIIGQSGAAGSTQSMGTREQARRNYEQLGYTQKGIGFERTQDQQALQSALLNLQRSRQEVGLSQQGLALQKQAAQQGLTYQQGNLANQTVSGIQGLQNQQLLNKIGAQNPQNYENYYNNLFGLNVSG